MPAIEVGAPEHSSRSSQTASIGAARSLDQDLDIGRRYPQLLSVREGDGKCIEHEVAGQSLAARLFRYSGEHAEVILVKQTDGRAWFQRRDRQSGLFAGAPG